MVFHYAQELFEGLKAYRDTNGKITMFRPDMKMKRMNNTAKRIALPVCAVFQLCDMIALIVTMQQSFNGDAVVELIKQLIRLDKHWIPDKEGYSLYIRPTFSEWTSGRRG